MQETVAGVTTRYIVGEVNPTGYVQVLAELTGTNLLSRYEWGLQLVAMRTFVPGTFTATTAFFGYDGHGSVRYLSDSTGKITDTYDYDAFGNLVSSTGTTQNNYLFAGEQFDPALGVYYNRARYYDQRQGRFWTMDTVEGHAQSPGSMHKFLYTGANPVDRTDPGGNEFDLATSGVAAIVSTTIQAITVVALGLYARGNLTQGDAEQPPSVSATSTNESSIEIYNSRLDADELFSGFMSNFRDVNDGNVASVTGAPVTGTGQKLTFQLHSNSLIGLLSFVGQSSFSVKTKRYDSHDRSIAIVTLQGHPLAGYRYWRVFSPDGRPGHVVIETGALDEPGPGPFDGVKFYLGRNQQLGVWREYLEDAVRFSGGREGSDPSYDFPWGVCGIPSSSEVFEQVTGVHP